MKYIILYKGALFSFGMVERYDVVRWRNRDVAYKVLDSNNIQVVGFRSEDGYEPLQQKLEKKCRAYLRGVDLGSNIKPRANIKFYKKD